MFDLQPAIASFNEIFTAANTAVIICSLAAVVFGIAALVLVVRYHVMYNLKMSEKNL